MDLLRSGTKATLKFFGLKSSSNKEIMEYKYFKQTTPFEKRKRECAKVISKHPKKLPLIIEPDEGSNVPIIGKSKVLITDSVTVGQLILVLKNKMEMNIDKSIILKVNGNIIPSGVKLKEIYEENHDDDGFLYLRYCDTTYG